MPDTKTYPVNLNVRISEAWRAYCGHMLAGRTDSAQSTMRRIDALLDCIPR